MNDKKGFADYRHIVYPAVILKQQLADGMPWFVAMHPDLPGCLADGPDPMTAMQELDRAREDYIESLIEDDLEVPIPLQGLTQSTTSSAGTVGVVLEVIKSTYAGTKAVSRLELVTA